MKKKIFFILFQQPKNKLKPKMFLKILIKILLKKNHYFLEEIKEKIYLVYIVALAKILIKNLYVFDKYYKLKIFY